MMNPDDTPSDDAPGRMEQVQGRLTFPNERDVPITFANYVSALPDTDHGIVFLTFGNYSPPDVSRMSDEQIAAGVDVQGRIIGRVALPMVRFQAFVDSANQFLPFWLGTQSEPTPDTNDS